MDHCRQQARLRQFVGDTRGVKVSFTMLVAGSVREGIATCARNLDADLLVMGGRGHSELSYVMLGSTVERLLNELPCSVLVVRENPGLVREVAAQFSEQRNVESLAVSNDASPR